MLDGKLEIVYLYLPNVRLTFQRIRDSENGKKRKSEKKGVIHYINIFFSFHNQRGWRSWWPSLSVCKQEVSILDRLPRLRHRPSCVAPTALHYTAPITSRRFLQVHEGQYRYRPFVPPLSVKKRRDVTTFSPTFSQSRGSGLTETPRR